MPFSPKDRTLIHEYVTSHLGKNNGFLCDVYKYLISKLHLVQNVTVKLIKGSKKSDHVTRRLCKLLQLMEEHHISTSPTRVQGEGFTFVIQHMYISMQSAVWIMLHYLSYITIHVTISQQHHLHTTSHIYMLYRMLKVVECIHSMVYILEHQLYNVYILQFTHRMYTFYKFGHRM